MHATDHASLQHLSHRQHHRQRCFHHHVAASAAAAATAPVASTRRCSHAVSQPLALPRPLVTPHPPLACCATSVTASACAPTLPSCHHHHHHHAAPQTCPPSTCVSTTSVHWVSLTCLHHHHHPSHDTRMRIHHSLVNDLAERSVSPQTRRCQSRACAHRHPWPQISLHPAHCEVAWPLFDSVPPHRLPFP